MSADLPYKLFCRVDFTAQIAHIRARIGSGPAGNALAGLHKGSLVCCLLSQPKLSEKERLKRLNSE